MHALIRLCLILVAAAVAPRLVGVVAVLIHHVL